MNALQQAQFAYSSVSTPIRTDRSTEYDAFAKVTRQLKSAAASNTGTIKPLAQAIHDNRRLWTLLASDVAGNDNALPKELRANIFYLAEFTQLHSRKVLNGEASVDALIDINASVMRGLRQKERAQ
ncbi:flagellar biosynthesis regulator FlaF [Parasulfitobacter algicola]|uniref:Flagellar biosynthesis regulator FlaF n=1 Tax=Parasulfitobacter algicola TaxID=2614809 RepID=A0ABX2IWU9_9RHOB|nr:flagellar biosynthesis regulator FlaF [Sulfitobacter algicola]